MRDWWREAGGWRLVLPVSFGLLLGIPIGVAFTGAWTDAGWFEASGVWVGAAATFGAIVWAAQTFLIQQRQERERVQLDVELAERSRVEDAELVTVTIRSGGGFTGTPARMTSVHVDVVNGSANIATDIRVWCPQLPEVDWRVRLLASGDQTTNNMPLTNGLEVTERALGGKDLPGVAANASYTLAGRRFVREGERVRTA